MPGKLDHEKAAKLARVRKQGSECIDPDDRTLLPNGFPSARDMANSPPRQGRLPIGASIPERKQEPIEVARAEIERIEAETKRARRRRRTKRKAQSKRRAEAMHPKSAEVESAPPEAKSFMVHQLFSQGRKHAVQVEVKEVPKYAGARPPTRHSREP